MTNHPTGLQADLPATLPESLAEPLADLGALGERFIEHYAALAAGLEASAADANETTSLRSRVQLLHGGQHASTPLSEPLATLTDLLAIDCHAITDEQIRALNAQRGPGGTVATLSAAAMMDAAERMDQVLARLLPTNAERNEETN